MKTYVKPSLKALGLLRFITKFTLLDPVIVCHDKRVF